MPTNFSDDLVLFRICFYFKNNRVRFKIINKNKITPLNSAHWSEFIKYYYKKLRN